MYAIDTNLVIGLINKKDRLNKMTIQFVKDKNPELLFIPRTVLVSVPRETYPL